MSSAIGIDIGGTKIRAARVSADGKIIAREIQATEKSPGAVLAQIEALIGRVGDAQTRAIGIGIPGRVHAATGEILSGGFVNLSGDLMSSLQGTPKNGHPKNCPIFFDNDASMALVGEARLGAAAGCAHVVMLTIGTGIGGALMLDGHVVHGKMAAGQLGHITVALDGPPCLCGRAGCLETFSSGTALGQLMSMSALDPATTLEDVLARGDRVSREILARWAAPLRAGIDSLVATFDPEIVVLGGGLGIAACRALAGFPARSPWYQCPVVPAALGDDAGMIGAALAALEKAQ